MRRLLLVLTVALVMAAISVANVMPAFASNPHGFENPHAIVTTGKDFKKDTPREGYVEVRKADTADTHEPPTDASGGNPGSTFNLCSGPSNNPIFGDPGC